jgi:hypothetical protein
MSSDAPTDPQRRGLLQIAAGLAVAGSLGTRIALAEAKKPAPTGKLGDFDFLTGEWKIHNKQPRAGGGFEEFEGEATVTSILGGLVSIEELRIPVRDFSGMGLRVLDLESKLWADYWVNAKSGIVGSVPAWGSFVDGVGLWDGDDKDGETPIIVRGAWDQITPRSCRWYQAVSRDDGKTWEDSWVMHWTRV